MKVYSEEMRRVLRKVLDMKKITDGGSKHIFPTSACSKKMNILRNIQNRKYIKLLNQNEKLLHQKDRM